MENCYYKKICNFYDNTCEEKLDCWVFNTLEGIVKKELFKSRINKRICRQEHGHKIYENVKW